MSMKEDLIEVVQLSAKIIGKLFELKFDGDPNDDDVFQQYSDEQDAKHILDYALEFSGFAPSELVWLRETAAKYEVI